MKTYNERIEELNFELEIAHKNYDKENEWFYRGQITLLKELRAEAIEEVKELNEIKEDGSTQQDSERDLAVIYYLKQKWSITNEEVIKNDQ